MRLVTKSSLPGLLLVVCGVLLLSTPIWAADEQDDALPQPEQVADGDADSPGQPVVASAQEEETVSVLKGDQRLSEIVGDRAYEVQGIAPWGGMSQNGKPEPLTGTVATLAFDRPTEFPMQEWPLIDYVPDQDPPYKQHLLHLAAENVTELSVNVDLQRGEVVHIEPYGEQVAVEPGEDYMQAAHPPTGE